MFKRIVNVVEVLALVATLAFVIALGRGSGSGSSAGGPQSGEEVYASSCARCHGGSGEGGVGPQLGNGAVVKEGLGGGSMPSFAGQLSEEEINAVVEYTRTGLG